MEMKGNELARGVSRKEARLRVKLSPQKVYLLKFLLEASGHLAFPTIQKGGTVILRADATTLPEVKGFLKELPFVDSIEEF
ncbi:MAG: DUF4911 domain-containing protein [Thermodesulfobacteria bacterium]|nr:DUF4911 domain-containing protein [Thermodesulfobacteriota bacterium]